jgi:serine/threonine protein kinase
MYEMATGRLPFAGPSPSETVSNVLDKDPAALTTLAPQHPKALETLVHRLLAKRARDRFTSAEELSQALRGLGTRSGRLTARFQRLIKGR